jgi:hypothetical protein
MQIGSDSTFNNIVNNVTGIQASGDSIPGSSGSFASGVELVWAAYGPCERLVVTGGSGTVVVQVTTSMTPQSPWQQAWPFQTYSNDFTAANLTTTASQVLATVSSAQRLDMYNDSKTDTVWCSFGNNAVDGAPSIPLPVNGKGINLDRPTGTTRDSINCKTDSSAATLSSLTIVFQ